MFDDGFEVSPLANMLKSLKKALEILSGLFPQWEALLSKFWVKCRRFERFGMPSQKNDMTNIGTGSCRVGVILAAQDFIANGDSAAFNIKWKYTSMNYLRLDLMKQIMRWSSCT